MEVYVDKATLLSIYGSQTPSFFIQSMVASFYHSLVLSQKVVFVNLIPKYVRWVSESVLTVRHHTDHQ